MKIFLDSIGCRLNQSEIEMMGRQLIAAGHKIVSDPVAADQVIINTCAVTREAAKDARKLTRRIHRMHPAAEITLTGCYASISPKELSDVAGVGRIVPNHDKDRIVQILDPNVKTSSLPFDQEPIMREFLSGATGKTRAFVKVQDGCDNRCTFCVTTLARGAGRSRHLDDIVTEIQAMVAAGYQEAVLTGVHLGSYGRDLESNVNLESLIAAIINYTNIPRLRISSLEPWDIAPDFFGLWEDPRLLPHLHVPLQSGSHKILRRMARRTTKAGFRSLAANARAHIPNLSLTTDLIVGFPGELEADFQESMDYVIEIGFSRLHVFPYSLRPGTAAATMDDQVPKKIKKERVGRMTNLGRSLSLAFNRRFEGRISQVLWETATGADENGLRWIGYTDNYIRVQAYGPSNLFNRITSTRLAEAHKTGITGEIMSDELKIKVH